MTVSIYYDGNCPFCSVLEMNGQRVGGAEAVNQIALLSTPSGLFNRLNKWIFSTSIGAAILYPFLRAGRWIILFLLGRKQFEEGEKPSLSRAAIFGSLFALFSIFHFLNYSLKYARFQNIELDLLLIVFTSVLVLVKPESPRLLFLLMLASTISAIAQAPIGSNHTIVRNFVLLGYWFSFIYTMFKGLKWSDIFTNFTTAGQATLIIMYFFGVFHKINSDFLNPETSCATALWREMPWPLNLVDTPIMHYLAIYGTFVIEGILVFMLFSRKLRHYAVVFGILFHLLLGLSNYAMYISFTTLAISLHCLFLNDESAQNIQNSKIMGAIKTRVRNPLYLATAIILFLSSAVVATFSREYSYVTLLMFPILLPFCYAIMRHGASRKILLNPTHRRSAHSIGILLGLAFFINCWTPYLGLKTAQSVNMFANLRLEDGVSNHLIMRSPPKPFKYLEDVVLITDSDADVDLKYHEVRKRGMIYYELLAQLDGNPKAVVSYTRAGKNYTDMTAVKLADDIEEILHPKWFRKWFHFKQADLERPEYCTN